MTTLHLLEIGKAVIEGGTIKGSAQVIINADGSKPRMLASFDATLNELVGELVLTDIWNETLPTHYTIGRKLRNDYANALKMNRGIFILKATKQDKCLYELELSFIDSTTSEFKVIKFSGIIYNSKLRTISIPKCNNEDHEVFLEEVLTTLLKPAFEAVTQRCVRLDFVNKLHHAFTLNKYGCPVDQRNAVLQ